MSKWENVLINKQNIKYDNLKSVLIACPHSSNYDGWQFWFPAKLIQDTSNKYLKKLVFNETFQFHLKKYGRGRFNRFEIINQTDIGPEDIKDMFSSTTDEPPEYKDPMEKHIPDRIAPVEIEADKELIDND